MVLLLFLQVLKCCSKYICPKCEACFSPAAWCLAVGDPVDLSLQSQFSPPFIHLEYSNLLVDCIRGRCGNIYLKTNFATRGNGGEGGLRQMWKQLVTLEWRSPLWPLKTKFCCIGIISNISQTAVESTLDLLPSGGEILWLGILAAASLAVRNGTVGKQAEIIV